MYHVYVVSHMTSILMCTCVTGSFSKRRYLSKCSGYPVAVNTTIMCKKNAFNNGEIISTENHVTLIMQLGCNLVMSIICNVVPAVRYLLVDHDWKLDPVTVYFSLLTEHIFTSVDTLLKVKMYGGNVDMFLCPVFGALQIHETTRPIPTLHRLCIWSYWSF